MASYVVSSRPRALIKPPFCTDNVSRILPWRSASHANILLPPLSGPEQREASSRRVRRKDDPRGSRITAGVRNVNSVLELVKHGKPHKIQVDKKHICPVSGQDRRVSPAASVPFQPQLPHRNHHPLIPETGFTCAGSLPTRQACATSFLDSDCVRGARPRRRKEP